MRVLDRTSKDKKSRPTPHYTPHHESRRDSKLSRRSAIEFREPQRVVFGNRARALTDPYAARALIRKAVTTTISTTATTIPTTM